MVYNHNTTKGNSAQNTEIQHTSKKYATSALQYISIYWFTKCCNAVLHAAGHPHGITLFDFAPQMEMQKSEATNMILKGKHDSQKNSHPQSSLTIWHGDSAQSVATQHTGNTVQSIVKPKGNNTVRIVMFAKTKKLKLPKSKNLNAESVL